MCCGSGSDPHHLYFEALQMIDLSKEKVLPLVQAIEKAIGNRVNPSTAYRWRCPIVCRP
jgi:hypothetical protein